MPLRVEREMSSGRKLLRGFLRNLLLLGVVWLLIVEATGGRKTKKPNAAIYRNMKQHRQHQHQNQHHRRMGKDDDEYEKQSTHSVSKFDPINYMSKRKIPNGPDPIHNRSLHFL